MINGLYMHGLTSGLCVLGIKKYQPPTLAGVAQWIEHQPVNQRVPVWVQSGHMPEFGARLPVGGAWEATTHWCFPLFLPPFPSQKIFATSSERTQKSSVEAALEKATAWDITQHHLRIPIRTQSAISKLHMAPAPEAFCDSLWSTPGLLHSFTLPAWPQGAEEFLTPVEKKVETGTRTDLDIKRSQNKSQIMTIIVTHAHRHPTLHLLCPRDESACLTNADLFNLLDILWNRSSCRPHLTDEKMRHREAKSHC